MYRVNHRAQLSSVSALYDDKFVQILFFGIRKYTQRPAPYTSLIIFFFLYTVSTEYVYINFLSICFLRFQKKSFRSITI